MSTTNDNGSQLVRSLVTVNYVGFTAQGQQIPGVIHTVIEEPADGPLNLSTWLKLQEDQKTISAKQGQILSVLIPMNVIKIHMDVDMPSVQQTRIVPRGTMPSILPR